MTVRKHVFCHGRVQRVGFRYHAQEAAWRLDLYGWIRNRACGKRVEILVEGPEDSVSAFVEWCRQGPTTAEVESIEVEDVEDRSEVLKPFGVRETE